jgi:hypothetical protein
MVILVPGTCTSPTGSAPPIRIERAIFERANPFTSSAWHLLHPFGSIEGSGALVSICVALFSEMRAKSILGGFTISISRKTAHHVTKSLTATFNRLNGEF